MVGGVLAHMWVFVLRSRFSWTEVQNVPVVMVTAAIRGQYVCLRVWCVHVSARVYVCVSVLRGDHVDGPPRKNPIL
jgi:hypothetical protein